MLINDFFYSWLSFLFIYPCSCNLTTLVTINNSFLSAICFYPSVYQLLCMTTNLSVCSLYNIPIYLFIHPSIHPSINPSIHQFIHPALYLSYHLFIHHSINKLTNEFRIRFITSSYFINSTNSNSRDTTSRISMNCTISAINCELMFVTPDTDIIYIMSNGRYSTT